MNALKEWLLDGGIVPANAVNPILFLVGLLLIAGLAFLANLIAKKGIVRVLHLLATRSQVKFLLLLQEHKIFTRLSHVAPAIVIQSLAPVLFPDQPTIVDLARTWVSIYLIGVGLLVIDGALNALVTAYNRLGSGKRMPIKSLVQAVKLVVLLIGLILMVAVLLDKSPLILMSGLGALGAIFLLVFKDAILGFVAGIQLSANNMVQTGDWIEMPKQQADGDVIDVSLTTVKVQNWDKTITTIPSYMLISDSFRNWRGMAESGGRRIKRSILIDMKSIRFADAKLLDRAKQFHLLRPYLEKVLAEIQEHNQERKLEIDDLLNGRHLTNIGIFRNYCAAYLRHHPKLNQNLTQIVRQLAPDEHGIPIELYCFTNDIRWVAYEGIQADIFDHLLAIIPHFGLRVYQQPSGSDLNELGELLAGGKHVPGKAEPSNGDRSVRLSAAAEDRN